MGQIYAGVDSTSYSVLDGTVSAILGGAVALTKTTAGTVTLSGANTYTGATTITAGTLALGHATNTLAVTAINVNGGTLALGANSDAVGVVTLTSGSITGTGGTLTGTSYSVLDGTVSAILGGAVALTKTTAGTVTLSGVNTYTGVTTISAGTLSVATIGAGGAAGNLGAAAITATNLVLGGGTLQYTGATASTDRNFTLTTATTSSIDVTTGATNLTITGASTNTTGALTKIGSGTLILSGANLYTGLTTISVGTLQYGASNAIAAGAVTVNDGGTYDLNGFSDSIGALTVNSGVTGGTVTTGVGTLTLGGNVTSTGGATNASIGGNLALGAARTFTTTNAADGLTVSAVISGAFALTKAGTGTLTLSGVNTYTGFTKINAGVLSAGSLANGGLASNIGASTNAATNLVLGGGTLQYTGATASTDRNFTLTTATTSSIDVTTGATNLTITGASTNTTGALTKIGAGTLTLSGANAYTGLTAVSAGTLAYGVTNALSSGAVTVSGGTLAIGAYSDTVGAVTLTSGSITGTGGTLTGTSYSVLDGTVSAILGGSAVALTKTTAGTVTLSGANTYTGATTISQGNLTISGAAGAAAFSSGFTVNSGAILELDNSAANNTDRIGDTRAITLNGGEFIFRGSNVATTNASETVGALTLPVADAIVTAFSGTGGSTVLTFASASRIAGATLLFRGNSLGAAAAADVSNIVFAADGGLDLTGGSGAAGSKNINIVTYAIGDTSPTGTGIGFVTYGAAGIRPLDLTTEYSTTLSVGDNVRLTASTTASTVTINSLLLDGAAAAIANPSTAQTVTVTTGAVAGKANAGIAGVNTTLAFGAVEGKIHALADLTVSGVMTGSAGLTKSGGAILTLSGANTYTWLTRINAGTLALDATGTIEASSGVANAGTFTIAANKIIDSMTGAGATMLGAYTLTIGDASNTTATYDGVISGAGSLTKAGAGTLTLSGANTYTGATAVNAGILSIAHATALGSTTGSTTVTSGASLELQGGITVGAEALTISGTGSATNGALRNLSGTNIYGGLVTLGAAATIQSDADSLALSHTGTITGAYGLTLDGAGNGSIASIIGTGSGTLTKVGVGTWTLSGANTYIGATTISAGTLQVGTGSTTGTLGTGAVTLANNAALLFNRSDAVSLSTLASHTAGITGTGSVTATMGGTFTVDRLINIAGPISISVTGSNGDIFVNHTVDWSANLLTLNAFRNININSTMNATGTASLALVYGQGAVAAGNTSNISTGTTSVVNLPASTTNFTTKQGSDGSVKNYTVITALGVEGSVTGTDLQGMGGNTTNLAKNYALGSNIDASATSTWNLSSSVYAGFAPVGNSATRFTGIFDGLGHTISNLFIYRPATSYVGLFGALGTGTKVQNIGLVGGSITGNFTTGALIGSLHGAIHNSFSTASVTGTSSTGGLVGYLDVTGKITDSYATGRVDGATSVGGLVGYLYNGINQAYISNSFATGAVTGSGSQAIGGLVGSGATNSGGYITNTYATGSVTAANSDYVGGLVGRNYFEIRYSYATGAVSGNNYTGGLTGENGTSNAQVTNSYATGAVIGAGHVGGLTGSNQANILNSYSSGAVTATGSNIGGLVGANYGSSVTASYWNTDTSISTSAGGTGKTTSQMQTIGTFSGWDFTTAPIWAFDSAVNNGHPILFGVNNSKVYLRVLDAGSSIYGNTPSITYGLYSASTGGGLVSNALPSGSVTWTGTIPTSTSNAGTYGLTYSSGITVGKSTYTLVAGAAANWTVTQRPITLTEVAQTKIYGNTDPTLSFTAEANSANSGLATTDTSASFTGALTRAAGENVASYAIANTLANGNYSITVTDGTFAITQRPITLTAQNKDKIYGNTDPELTFTAEANSTDRGLVGSDTFTGVLTRTAGENVGSYTINAAALANGNYLITAINGTFAITQRPITLTAQNKDKIYGNTDPELTFTAEANSTDRGLVGSDTFTGVLTRTAGENVGSYTINAAALANGNYLITAINGTLGITQAALTAIMGSLTGNVTKTYDGTDVATLTTGNYLLSGWVGSDGATVTKTGGTYNNANAGSGKTVTVSLSAGDYSATGATNLSNYTLPTSVSGSVGSISQRPITVTADDKTKVFGNSDPSLTYQVTIGNLITGDSLSGALTRSAGEDVGNHTINAAALANGNYLITAANGVLTISQRPVTALNTTRNQAVDNAVRVAQQLVSTGPNPVVSGPITGASSITMPSSAQSAGLSPLSSQPAGSTSSNVSQSGGLVFVQVADDAANTSTETGSAGGEALAALPTSDGTAKRLFVVNGGINLGPEYESLER